MINEFMLSIILSCFVSAQNNYSKEDFFQDLKKEDYAEKSLVRRAAYASSHFENWTQLEVASVVAAITTAKAQGKMLLYAELMDLLSGIEITINDSELPYLISTISSTQDEKIRSTLMDVISIDLDLPDIKSWETLWTSINRHKEEFKRKGEFSDFIMNLKSPVFEKTELRAFLVQKMFFTHDYVDEYNYETHDGYLSTDVLSEHCIDANRFDYTNIIRTHREFKDSHWELAKTDDQKIQFINCANHLDYARFFYLWKNHKEAFLNRYTFFVKNNIVTKDHFPQQLDCLKACVDIFINSDRNYDAPLCYIADEFYYEKVEFDFFKKILLDKIKLRNDKNTYLIYYIFDSGISRHHHKTWDLLNYINQDETIPPHYAIAVASSYPSIRTVLEKNMKDEELIAFNKKIYCSLRDNLRSKTLDYIGRYYDEIRCFHRLDPRLNTKENKKTLATIILGLSREKLSSAESELHINTLMNVVLAEGDPVKKTISEWESYLKNF